MKNKVLLLIESLTLLLFFINKISLNSFYTIISFIVIYYLLSHISINEKYKKSSKILAIIFSIIYIICDSVNINYFIDIFNKNLLLNICSYLIIFFYLFNVIFTFIDYLKEKDIKREVFIGYKNILTTSKYSFVVNFVFIFFVQILFLLKFYPGLFTYDSVNQLEQINGILPLMNNNPIFHTFIISVFYKIGLLLNNANYGIFLYSLFQTFIVSFLFSYILYYMAKKEVPIYIRIISLLFFMFHPINIFYSITVLKDVFFSVCVTIFSIQVYNMSKDDNYFNNKKNIALFIIISLLTIYTRNNGFIVVIGSLFILFIFMRNNYKRVLPIFLSILFLFLSSKIIIFKSLNIQSTSVAETLSFPSQSIARIYKYDFDKLNTKEKKMIESFYSDKVGEKYIPTISDNTKGMLNVKYFNKHKKDYLVLNMKLMVKHPKRYLESFVSNSYGYYYINTNNPTISIDKIDHLGVKNSSKIHSLILYCFIVLIITVMMIILLWNLNNKQYILFPFLLVPILFSLNIFELKNNPLVSILFNISFYFIITFISYIYNIVNKKRTWIYIPTIILYLTILLSPVSGEFRYLYSMFMLTPLFIGLTLSKNVNDVK